MHNKMQTKESTIGLSLAAFHRKLSGIPLVTHTLKSKPSVFFFFNFLQMNGKTQKRICNRQKNTKQFIFAYIFEQSTCITVF